MSLSNSVTHFSHFDLHGDNIKLKAYNNNNDINPDEPIPSGKYFKFIDAQGHASYVPAEDTWLAVPKIMDFGTSTSTVSVSRTIKHRVGPRLMHRFDQRSAQVINTRYFFFLLVSYTPQSTWKQVEREYPEFYQQLSELFYRAMGFEYMGRKQRVMLSLARFTTWRGKYRPLWTYGMPDRVFTIGKKARRTYWESYGSYVMLVLSKRAVQLSPVTYEEILGMDFYSVYRQVRPAAVDEVVTVAKFPESSWFK